MAESKPKGSKLSLEIEADARISALESEVAELRSLLFSNESDNLHETRKSKAEGEIRTRVVASTGP
jgi:hypothetical protein